ncbi:MAG: flagellar biosynthetic protein FliR [Oligoflexales bacterium]|nr:flagellar biosynthetic protein FliR [Oligoflexales bacterium]
MLALDLNTLLSFALIFIRVGAIIFALPIFGDQPIPVQVRVMLAVALSFLIFGDARGLNVDVANLNTLSLALLVLKEIFIGIIFGFIARVIISGLTMAAELVGYQMGFGTANLLVPDADMQMNAFTALHRIIVILIFLTLNLHFLFISGIIESFSLVPIGTASITGATTLSLTSITAEMFLVAFKLSAPVLVALLFAMSAMGLMARTVPQMNVFTFSFPASFFLGLIIYIATIPFFPSWFTEQFTGGQQRINAALEALSL